MRLLIVSIVFVGNLLDADAKSLSILLRTRAYVANGKNGGGAILIILIALVIAAVGYFFASLMRFAIHGSANIWADAGSRR